MDHENSKMLWFSVSVVLLITIILVNAHKENASINANLNAEIEANHEETKIQETKPSALEKFAQCLTDKGVKLYGAYWCSHCKHQKKMFKEGLKNLTYVECEKPSGGQTEPCRETGIRAYPTWIFQNGKRVIGELSLEQISKLSGCTLEN